MMRVLGIVPARGGSTRVSGKNMRPLGGKPLVAWAIEAALAAETLADVLLTSDAQEILDVGSSYPVEQVRRPDELSDATALAITYVEHSLATMSERGHDPYDAIAIIQPTSPFTEGADIDDTVRLVESSGAGSAVTVMRVDHALHPVKMKTFEGDRLVAHYEEEAGRMAEHELPALYVRNGSVYVSRTSVIESGILLADDCRGVVMPPERSVDINVELDLEFAEFLLARRGQTT